MQPTSSLYKAILLSGNYHVETSLAIDGATAANGYKDNVLISLKTTHRVFADGVPQAGCCISGEIYVEMLMPDVEIPFAAQLVPYVRLAPIGPGTKSEWVQKGVYYIDTRSNTRNDDELDVLRLHGYDAMIKASQPYGSSSLSWPATDIAVIQEIASKMGVAVDPDCVDLIDKSYEVQYPANYTLKEALGFIAAMYAGNWIINDYGQLQLICLNDLPPETNLLVDEHGYRITFGGDRILL